MKIALVSPFISKSKSENINTNVEEIAGSFWVQDRFYNQIPLSLLILATYFEKPYIHCEDIQGEFKFNDEFDLILLSFTTCQAERAYEIAELCRINKIPSGGGGIHPSFLTEEVCEKFDFVFVGELESVMEKFKEDFNSGLKTGLYRGEKTESENWKIPAYNLIDFKKQKMIPIQATRGCPVGCDFCTSTNMFGKKIRRKSMAQLRKELDLITVSKDEDDEIELLFVDDNLFLNEEYAISLMEVLKEYPYEFATYSDIRIGKNEKLLKIIKDAGLKFIFAGLETVNGNSLGEVSAMKHRILPRYPEFINRIQSMGIGVFGSFIIGFDDDTEESIDAIKDFLRDNMLYRASFGFLTPYPGTSLYERMKKDDRLENEEWSNFTEWNIILKHPILEKEILKKKIIELYSFFYSREMGMKRIKYFKNIKKEI